MDEDKHKRLLALLHTVCIGSFNRRWFDAFAPFDIGVGADVYSLKKGDSVIVEPPNITLMLKSQKEPEPKVLDKKRRDTPQVQIPIAAVTKFATTKGTTHF